MLFAARSESCVLAVTIDKSWQFDMDVEICDQCGGGIKVIACIEDPMVIKKILDHMNSKSAVSEKKRQPQSRALPLDTDKVRNQEPINDVIKHIDWNRYP